MSPAPVQETCSRASVPQYSYNMFASNAMPPLDLGIYFPDHSQPINSEAVIENLMPADSPESLSFEPTTFDSISDINFSYSHQMEL